MTTAPRAVPANLEGFLFPATYEMPKDAERRRSRPAPARHLRAADQGRRHELCEEEEPDRLRRPDHRLDDRGRGTPQDFRYIAAVVYNRLHDGIALGIDATVRFAVGNYDQPLTESELATGSPYNTRINRGLPPGPIGNPGMAAIRAAANPSRADYLYYVTKPGSCNRLSFSSTQRAVPEGRRRLQQGAGRRRAETRRPTADERGRATPAAAGSPCSGIRSPTRARRRCRTPLSLPSAWARAGATRRSTSLPRSSSERVRAMPGEGFVGANVTVPHKAAALALADGASPVAREIGAANTLSFEAGAITAENTDAPGLIAALPRPGRRVSGARPRRRRRGAGRSLGAGRERGPRSRSGTGRSRGRGGSARSSGEARSSPPTRVPST